MASICLPNGTMYGYPLSDNAPDTDTAEVVQCTYNGNLKQQPYEIYVEMPSNPNEWHQQYIFNIINNGHGGILHGRFNVKDCDESHERELVTRGRLASLSQLFHTHLCTQERTTTTEIISRFAQLNGSILLLNESASSEQG